MPEQRRIEGRQAGEVCTGRQSRRGIVGVLGLVGMLLAASPATAQTAAEIAAEVQLRQAMPYARALTLAPGITVDDYNVVMRQLAREQVAGAGPVEARRAPARPVVPYTVPTPRPQTTTTQRLGAFTYSSSSDGTSGTATSLPPFTFYNFSDGTTGSSQRIGATTYSNFSNRGRSTSSTTTQIGQFQYYNRSDGTTGTSQRIGNSTYSSFSNGTRCTSTRIGTTVYTNCY